METVSFSLILSEICNITLTAVLRWPHVGPTIPRAPMLDQLRTAVRELSLTYKWANHVCIAFFSSDIIRKKALKYFAKTIPTLKKDEHVPKVAMFEGAPYPDREHGGADYFSHHERRVRSRRSSDNSKVNEGQGVQADKVKVQRPPAGQSGVSEAVKTTLGVLSKTNVTREQARQFLSALCGGQDNL